MKVSILVPTYNNLNYLRLFISSIQKNSNYKHQIILHINDGSDGTLQYAKKEGIAHTHSPKNIGLCSSINKAASLATSDFILYAHDDMFFCKNWDTYLENDLRKYTDNLYYLTGTNISKSNGLINFDCGTVPENFDEDRFNRFCDKDESRDLQGSHWAPHLIHKELWNIVGGFSDEFNPGDGSDPDFCMKLWNNDVRVFKTISKFKVYHFSSVTTRKKDVILNNGTKTFILKYGFNPRFFRKYYLKGDGLNTFDGKLSKPKMNLIMFFDLIINKFKFLYFSLFR